MKHVIVRCEDGAGVPRQVETLLEGAHLNTLHQLAQAGAAGLLAPSSNRGGAIDRVAAHQALLGLDPDEPDAAPGRWYAAGLGLPFGEHETAWCCDLITHRDGAILDPTAGRIPTKESAALVKALNARAGSTACRWIVGEGPCHLLVTAHAALRADPQPIRSAELLVGRPWRRALPKGPLGAAMAELLQTVADTLEAHEVNRVRVDLGENPANMAWLWGAGRSGSPRPFVERTGRSGALVSSTFLGRGLAAALGLTWAPGLTAADEQAFRDLAERTWSLLEHHDVVYVHVRVDTADPVERLCAMERMDQALVRPLAERLPSRGSWRLLVAIDDRVTGDIPLVAIGSGLPRQPVARLSAGACAESPLQFRDRALFEWFIAPAQGNG